MGASEEHDRPIYATTPWEEDLIPGKTYRVIQAFADFDGHVHPEGEEWQYSGLSVFVRYRNGDEDQIRMACEPEAQGRIVDSWAAYARALGG